jgi:sugar phosphate isomerase/epimerase
MCKESNRMQLACFVSNRGLRQLEYARFVQSAQTLGYTAIDVPINIEGAAAQCRQLGLNVGAAGPLVPADLSPDAARQEEIIERFKTTIDSLAAQEIPVLVCLIGRDVSRNGDENIAIYKDVFTPIAAHAEDKGVRLAFENWPRNGTMLAITPELWDGMFNAVPSNAIGLCYDPSHLYWMGIDYIQPIWDFSDRIYHTHAKDTEILPEGQNYFGIYGRQLEETEQRQWWRYRLPGYGAVDWTRYLDTLYQIGYDGILSVEHEDPVWEETPEQALRGLQLAQQFLQPLLS